MRDQNFSMRVSERFKLDLDELRKAEPDLPSQTEMLHRLVERASPSGLRSARLQQKQERRQAKDKLRAKASQR